MMGTSRRVRRRIGSHALIVPGLRTIAGLVITFQKGNDMIRRLFVQPILLFVLAATFVRGTSGEEKRDFSRWEKAVVAFEEQDKKKPPPKNPIVFVGSSSIRLWDLEKSFPDLPAINRGFGGSEIADSVNFAPRIVLKYEPRLIVLYAGDNDIANGKSPEQVAADFQTFTRVIHDRLPKTKILFLSIKLSLYRWALVEKMRKANALIAEQCKEDDRLLYLDVATPLLGEDGKPRRDLFRADGLHLSEKGYEVWAQWLKPHLKTDKAEATKSKKK
jgi:lysophospholipase L1-like esterase